MPSLARLTLVEGAIHDINLSKLEQLECIALASSPLKVRNPRWPETGTKHAKSVKLTMPMAGSEPDWRLPARRRHSLPITIGQCNTIGTLCVIGLICTGRTLTRSFELVLYCMARRQEDPKMGTR
jgi:hypothetical protein